MRVIDKTNTFVSVVFPALVADFVRMFVVFPEAVVEPVLDAPAG